MVKQTIPTFEVKDPEPNKNWANAIKLVVVSSQLLKMETARCEKENFYQDLRIEQKQKEGEFS